MENELKIGEYNHLRIIKEVPFGLYLDGYEDEILLPLQYVPETYESIHQLMYSSTVTQKTASSQLH